MGANEDLIVECPIGHWCSHSEHEMRTKLEVVLVTLDFYITFFFSRLKNIFLPIFGLFTQKSNKKTLVWLKLINQFDDFPLTLMGAWP